ncbi:hypothetical protein B0H14DRAFT_2625885 [Mycena olivaceomarginata]|nr:hypothetical protein B0H14DRAFT_2625885 [Mycena olivaceomarginata]
MYKSSSSYAIYATHIAQPTSRSSRVKLMYTRLIEMRRRKFVDRNVNPPSVFAADYDTQNTTRQPTSGFGWVKLMYTRLIEMRRRSPLATCSEFYLQIVSRHRYMPETETQNTTRQELFTTPFFIQMSRCRLIPTAAVELMALSPVVRIIRPTAVATPGYTTTPRSGETRNHFNRPHGQQTFDDKLQFTSSSVHFICNLPPFHSGLRKTSTICTLASMLNLPFWAMRITIAVSIVWSTAVYGTSALASIITEYDLAGDKSVRMGTKL